MFTCYRFIKKYHRIYQIQKQQGMETQTGSLFRNLSHETKVNNFVDDPNIKHQLLQDLHIEIKKLNFVKGVDNLDDDIIFEALQKIEERAKQNGYPEIKKLAHLAKGKRILNIEIERKRNELEEKKKKKKVIEDFFRENRIKEIDYQDLSLKKLQNNTLIVQPYFSGKGFIESHNMYTEFLPKITKSTYEHALNQCQYLDVVKEVNRIFFKNFSEGSAYDRDNSILNSNFIRFILLFLTLEFVICCCLIAVSDLLPEYMLIVNTSITLVLILIMASINFFKQTTNNDQLNQTIELINIYFQRLNDKFIKEGKHIEWKCPQQFLYLEVEFGRVDNLRDSSTIK